MTSSKYSDCDMPLVENLYFKKTASSKIVLYSIKHPLLKTLINLLFLSFFAYYFFIIAYIWDFSTFGGFISFRWDFVFIVGTLVYLLPNIVLSFVLAIIYKIIKNHSKMIYDKPL